MPEEQLFRFVAVREIQRAPRRPSGVRVLAYGEPDRSALHSDLADAVANGSATGALVAEHLASVGERGYRLSGAPALLQDLDELLLEDGPGSARDIWRFVEDHLTADGNDGPVDLPALVASSPFQADRLAYGDTLIAAALAPAAPPEARQDVTRILVLWGLLAWAAEHDDARRTQVADALDSAEVILPADIFPAAAVPGAPSAAPPMPAPAMVPPPRVQDLLDAAEALGQLARASGEVEVTPLALPSLDDGGAPALEDALAAVVLADPSWTLTQEALARLPEAARSVIDATDVGLDIPTVVERLQRRAADAYRLAASEVIESDGALVHELARLRGELTAREVAEIEPVEIEVSTVPLVRPPVVGELEIVRQTLLRYERGDVAHVENVLAGESKERHHRVFDVREEATTTTTEEEREHRDDNQTTDRNEFERETNRTQQSDESINVGASVSGQYGPYVKVTATAGYAKSDASSEGEHNARRYARDVSERSANRLRQRTEEVRRSLTRREVTERNDHVLSNPGDEHVTGIYRWVDKLYRAQTYNYGKRVLLELAIPDPSANVRYAAARGAGLEVAVDPPPRLTLPLGNGAELVPGMINAANWQALAARFRVSGLTPPPPVFATVTMPLTADQPASGQGGGPAPLAVYRASRELALPAGYNPLRVVACLFSHGSGALESRLVELIAQAPQLGQGALAVIAALLGASTPANLQATSVAIGPVLVQVPLGSHKVSVPFNFGQIAGQPAEVQGNAQGPLAVAVATDGGGFAMTLTLMCEQTLEGYQAWQQRSYEAIVQAHAAWETDYRSAVSAARAAAGVMIQGRNPVENAQTVRNELKRSAIELLGNIPAQQLQASAPGSPEQGTPPRLDRAAAARAGRIVEFYEQAFEWPQMGWILYPYFWTGRDDWPEASRRDDPDTAFAQFLRAGSARVVVPVRPGFAKLVSTVLGLQLSEPWPDAPAPVPGRDPWLSLSDEIRATQDDFARAVPVGEPWEVRVPTTLVVLDDAGSDLPVFVPTP